MDHYVGGSHVVELENIFDHFLLFGLNSTLLLTQVDKYTQPLLGYLLILIIGIDAEEPQDGVGGDGKQPDQRAHDGGQQTDHTAGKTGHRFALFHGHPLGYQFAKDQSKEGEDHSDHDHRQGMNRGHHRPGQRERGYCPLGKGSGQIVGGKGRPQETGQGDADLDGGEKPGGHLYDPEQLGCLAVAAFGLLSDKCLV